MPRQRDFPPSLSAFSSLQSVQRLESSSLLWATECRTQSRSLESQATSLERQATSARPRAWSAMARAMLMVMDLRTRAANSASLHNNLLELAEDCRRLAVIYEQLGDDVGRRIAPFLITTVGIPVLSS